MMATADNAYSHLIEGLALLITNPLECSAIWLIQLFAAGLVALVTIHLSGQMIATIRLRRCSVPLNDPALLRSLRECAGRFALARPPRLMVSPASCPPVFTAGLLSPAIYLSPELVSRLDDDEMRAVLCHELAHVERRDNLSSVVLRGAGVVILGLIPAALVLEHSITPETMHFGSMNARLLQLAIILLLIAGRGFLWRPLIALREISCDDRAVQSAADPLALASAIAKTWRLQRSASAAPWSGVGFHSLLGFNSGAAGRMRRLLRRRGQCSPIALTVLRRAAALLLMSALLFVASYHVRSGFSEKPPMRWSRISPP